MKTDPKLDRIVLGFSLRNASQTVLSSIWTHSNRKTHLLVEDIRLPITVDALMLPFAKFVEPFRGEDGNWAVNPAGLFERLADFEGFTKEAVASDDFIQLAVTSSRKSLEHLAQKRGFPDEIGSHLGEADLLRKGWELLGFDCVDFDRVISGLSDCGYRNKPQWRTEFGSALNEYGLFRDPEAAERFSEKRGQELPEHAPFVPAGVLLKGRLPSWYTSAK